MAARPPARHRLATTVGVAGALAVVLAGCVPQGLAFRADQRLTIVRPGDRSTVSLPVTIDWDVRDFAIVGPGHPVKPGEGYFAVFVDTTPVPPGKPLSYLARKDPSCRAADGCPDEDYLNKRGVYTTTDTKLVLDQLPDTSTRRSDRERHRATIVLVDPSGTRIGESAFDVAFDVKRPDQG